MNNIVSKCAIAGLAMFAAVSCIKSQEYDPQVAEDTNVDMKDTLIAAIDSASPRVFKIDADLDGTNDCSLVLYLHGDSCAYTVLRPISGTDISIVSDPGGLTAPYHFAKNYGAGDTIHKTDTFIYDTVLLAYRNTADVVYDSVNYGELIGKHSVAVFRKTTNADISYWWLEFDMVDYSQVRLKRHSLPTVVELR